jgi:hypothetical protein
MGSITRGLSNNITTGGVILPTGITNASVADVTSFANATAAATLVLLSTQTASNSATISFTTGLNSTYDAYEFHFIDIHPRTDSVSFDFNLSTDSGSNYNVTKTTTMFGSYHYESDLDANLLYNTAGDLAQSTAFQRIASYTNISNDADSLVSGSLQLFNPSSTTYVKHFISIINSVHTDPPYSNFSLNSYLAGYGNTTSAVNAVRFQMSSGNFDGDIKLYGVKKS